MDVLDSPVRQQQATFMFEVSASLECAIETVVFVVQHPAIFAVCAQDASFMQEGSPLARDARHFSTILRHQRMNERCPLPALQIL